MLYNEAYQALVLIKSNNVVRIFAVLIVLASIAIGVFYSVVGGCMILGSYILGFIICWFLTEYQTTTSSYLQLCANFYQEHVSPFKKPRFHCPVCDKDTCQRHHSIISMNPWKNLYINEELNDAIEHFYNRILEEFVNSWYKNLTDDESFLGELKACLRYATASLVNKLLDANPGQIITNRLVPCAIKHVDDYLCMQQIAKLKCVSFDNVIVEYLGNRLHVATTNRKNEVEYLRQLTQCLLPEVLPPAYFKCRNYNVLMREIIAGWVLLPLMDVIASPDTINLLVILSTTYKANPQPVTSQQDVELLQNFVKSSVQPSPFSCDLKVVLRTTELLYAFIQFLKREGPMHILQFCLDLEEFNNKLLTPDMSKDQLEALHMEATTLYKNYFRAESTDFIGCSQEISNYLNLLLQESVYNVSKLRTSEPLYEAYDFAYGILENDCLPLFFHSKEFYNCICVSRPLKSNSGSKTKKYYESSQGAVAKIGSGLVKIKGALKPNQPVEGSVYQTDLLVPDPNFVEDIILNECDNIFRDLSSWRVAINAIYSVQHGPKTILYLDVIVRRIDTGSEHMVKRKEQDFHTLRAKLIEFHGEHEIPDTQFPTRRSSMPMDMRKAKYEEFIQNLLQKPSLRGSDLLYTFLTTKQDFTAIAPVPVVEDLGNIYQSVAFKLRKEKGQHLENFMNTFLSSTATVKPSKFEWEVGDEADILSFASNGRNITPATYYSEIFENNFGVDVEDIAGSYSSPFNPEGMTESLFYLLKHAFKARESVLKFFAAICSVAQQSVESFFQHFINKHIKLALCQSNLTVLIKLLEQAIFDDSYVPTKEELQKRKETAFEEIEKIFPIFLQKIVGCDLKQGLVNLLEILQNARYNKQLAYYLLDNIVAELYPHVNKEVKDC